MNTQELPQANTQTRTTDDHRVGSPSATGGSITIHGSVRDWVVGLLLALSIAGNIFAGYHFSRKEQAEDLKRYDLDFFVRNEYSTLKSKVEAHEILINALGLHGCKQEK